MSNVEEMNTDCISILEEKQLGLGSDEEFNIPFIQLNPEQKQREVKQWTTVRGPTGTWRPVRVGLDGRIYGGAYQIENSFNPQFRNLLNQKIQRFFDFSRDIPVINFHINVFFIKTKIGNNGSKFLVAFPTFDFSVTLLGIPYFFRFPRQQIVVAMLRTKKRVKFIIFDYASKVQVTELEFSGNDAKFYLNLKNLYTNSNRSEKYCDTIVFIYDVLTIRYGYGNRRVECVKIGEQWTHRICAKKQ